MRRCLFVGIKSVVFLSICFFLVGCNSEKRNSLEGAWERVEAKFTTAGETETPSGTAIKMFTKNYWVIVEQGSNEALGGTYTFDGETLTEFVEFGYPQNWIGFSLSFNVKWEGDKWIQTGKFPMKALGLGENDMESYEVWKRID